VKTGNIKLQCKKFYLKLRLIIYISHLITIPPGPHILSDVILSSAILADEDGAPPAGFGSGGFEFGVDPSLDPELALALRISMEEERARQEALSKGEGGGSETMAGVESTTSAVAGGAYGNSVVDELARALALSMGGGAGADNDAMETEDDEIQKAIALSMSQGSAGTGTSSQSVRDI
jgi:26S proteasome regulatory subunit N10